MGSMSINHEHLNSETARVHSDVCFQFFLFFFFVVFISCRTCQTDAVYIYHTIFFLSLPLVCREKLEEKNTFAKKEIISTFFKNVLVFFRMKGKVYGGEEAKESEKKTRCVIAFTSSCSYFCVSQLPPCTLHELFVTFNSISYNSSMRCVSLCWYLHVVFSDGMWW